MKSYGLYKYVIFYFALVLCFIYFLHFVDFFNLQIFLQASSYLYLSQNPYAFFPNQFPPNLFFFLLPNFILYLHSKDNIYVSIYFLKIFQMMISTLTAVFIYKIILISTKNIHKAKCAFLAFLFSPVIFWANYFQLEQSPVGIFFTVLALYFLIISINKDKDFFPEIFASSLLLIYASYVYVIPLVIIPVIFIYQKSIRKFLSNILAFSLSFSLFYIPYLLLHGFDLIGGTSAIATYGAGASIGFTIIGLLGPHIYPIDSFQLMLKFVFEIIFILSIFIVPVSMRLLKIKNIFIPILTNLSMIFLFITISNLDEFSWLVPFAILVFSISMQEKRLLWKQILIQLYDIPYIILFLIDDSNFNLNGSGIFYLGYLQFHKNIDLDLQWWAPLVNKVLIISGFVAIILLLTGALWSWNRSRKTVDSSVYGTIEDESILNVPNSIQRKLNNKKLLAEDAQGPDKIRRSSVFNTIFIMSICAIFALSVVPVHNANTAINISEPVNPVGIFTSQPIMGNSTTYKYIDNYKSLYVFPTNSTWEYGPNAPFYFSRNMTGENSLLNISVKPVLSGRTSVFDYSVISIGNLFVNILDVPSIPNGSFPMDPFMMENTTIVTGGNSTLYKSPGVSIYGFNGTSVIEYNLNRSAFLNDSFGFIFHLDRANWTNQIMYLKYQNQLFQIFNPPESNKIILGYSDSPNWTFLNTYFAVQQWNSVEFRLVNSMLTVNINGNGYVKTNFSMNGSGNSTLAIGKDFYYPAFNFKYALKGEESSLFDIPNGSIDFKTYSEIFQSNKTCRSTFAAYVEEYIVINKTQNKVNIETNNIQFSAYVNSSLMKFGRIGISPIPTIFAFNSIEINSYQHYGYLYNYILIIYLPPVVATGFLILKNRRQLLNLATLP